MSNNDVSNEGDQPVEEEEVEKPPFHFEIVRKVNKEEDRSRVHNHIRGGLSQIGKSYNQTGYAYTHLDVKDKKIADLYDLLPPYQYLRIADMSKNSITDVSTLNQIPYLLDLNLSNNKISTLAPFTHDNRLQFLQTLNLSENKLAGLDAIVLPKLRKLYLNANQIESCEKLNGHPTLETLEIRNNKLKNLKGIERMSHLKDLDLSENQINNINDLQKLQNLKTLILQKNKLTGFVTPLPVLENLNFLNVGINKIKIAKELEKLREFKTLKVLEIVENPFADEFGGECKREVIMILPQLTKIGEEEVEEEERKDALDVLKARIEAEEEERRQEEQRKKEEEDERLRIEEEKRREEEEEREKKRAEEEEEEERRRNEEQEENAKKEALEQAEDDDDADDDS